jgi:dolichol-phosphate mannosyltransferase
MKISLIIPAYNEEASIEKTVNEISSLLEEEKIPYEILVVNDNSRDNTEAILKELSEKYPSLRYVNNQPPNGIGLAIQKGLQHYSGDAAAIVMADGSDSPADIVQYYRSLQEGYECVMGSRFIKEGKVINYPKHKLILNRFANWFIKILFNLDYNDVTNAFKCYRKEVIDGIKPILSHHFNITVELPLKAIVRGYSFKIVPIVWRNRTEGVSKLRIKEMGSRYLFIVLYVFLEKLLSKGDYLKKNKMGNRKAEQR